MVVIVLACLLESLTSNRAGGLRTALACLLASRRTAEGFTAPIHRCSVNNIHTRSLLQCDPIKASINHIVKRSLHFSSYVAVNADPHLDSPFRTTFHQVQTFNAEQILTARECPPMRSTPLVHVS